MGKIYAKLHIFLTFILLRSYKVRFAPQEISVITNLTGYCSRSFEGKKCPLPLPEIKTQFPRPAG
jgi:hypothetical protein